MSRLWHFEAGLGLKNEKKFRPERWLNGEMDEVDNMLKI